MASTKARIRRYDYHHFSVPPQPPLYTEPEYSAATKRRSHNLAEEGEDLRAADAANYEA